MNLLQIFFLYVVLMLSKANSPLLISPPKNK